MSDTSPSLHFSGSIPQNYEHYLGPMFFEPYAVEIAERIEPSAVQFALELACGTGRVTRHLREIIPAASTLIASDISPDMLAVAREKLKHLEIDWKIMDAQELPFDNNRIDLIVCCFGYMFVPDRSKAFAEAYRVLRPGGMLLLSTWDKLERTEASHVFRTTVKKYLGDALPESYQLPFSMHDPAAIKALLQRAGFSKVTSAAVKKNTISTTAREAAQGLVKGGSLYNEILKQNPAWLDEIILTVEKELSEKYGSAPMIAPMSAIISQAWK